MGELSCTARERLRKKLLFGVEGIAGEVFHRETRDNLLKNCCSLNMAGKERRLQMGTFVQTLRRHGWNAATRALQGGWGQLVGTDEGSRSSGPSTLTRCQRKDGGGVVVITVSVLFQ